MATSDLTIEAIYDYFKENGNVVKNRDLVHHFKEFLTNPASKDDARIKFKKYVNTLAQTKAEGDEKFLILKTKYQNSLQSPKQTYPNDPWLSLGIPVSPSFSVQDYSPSKSPAHRQPPPYRPPPPVVSPTNSLDNVSLSSIMSGQDGTPQAPPRRKAVDRLKSGDEELTPSKLNEDAEDEKKTVSVKERMEKFNRMASMEDELSPRQKASEKMKVDKGTDEDDGASVASLEPKKCTEWYVTASKGDIQELLKLAQDEPRLVNRKDPFTAYTVLHWGAKHGNEQIIKIFAGKYKVDVNGKTNGGYTPMHLAAQFGHRVVYNMLMNEYKADAKIRDYSGRLPAYYFQDKDQKGRKDNVRSEYNNGTVKHGKIPSSRPSFRFKPKPSSDKTSLYPPKALYSSYKYK